MYNSHQKVVGKCLDFFTSDGYLNASHIENIWFPNVEADIFISHSHKDVKQAIALASILYDDFGLRTFVDYALWGHTDDLLRKIDNMYCVSKRNSYGEIDTYSYEKRNRSIAHVHIMLNGALMKMMDSTECLIFMDTPNPIYIYKML